MIPPFFDGGAVRVYRGHVLDVLRDMPDESAHMVVTSPPYYGLRSYDTDPVIWDGNPSCDHVWGIDEGYVGHRGKRGQVPQTKWPAQQEYPQYHSRKHAPGNTPSQKSTLLTNAGRGPKPGDKYASVGRNDTGRQFFPGHTGNYQEIGPKKAVVFAGAFCAHCTAWYEHLGLEPYPDLFVEHLVTIFREVRRVLHKAGTLWIVIGDTYNSGPGGRQGQTGQRRNRTFTAESAGWRPGNSEKNQGASNRDGVNAGSKYKPKDLIGIPWMLAFALRADGWYLRSEISWTKPDCRPESVTDRPTKAHETIFLLAKSERYFYDRTAVEEPAVGRFTGRNLRSVWSIVSEAFSGQHFAVFPSALARRCILAGTSAKGVCPTCGAPWVRILRKTGVLGRRDRGRVDRLAADLNDGRAGETIVDTLGWHPTCTCQVSEVVPAVVLDPFAGTGTSLLVARSLGRHAVGIELSGKYCDLIVRRVGQPYQEEGEETTRTKLLPRQPSVFDP